MNFGYFGAADYTPVPVDRIRIAEIADHCSLGFLGTWGCNSGDPLTLANWHIDLMHAGITAGIEHYVLGIDVLVYELPSFAHRPRAQAGGHLAVYLAALREQGLLGYIDALYPVDEPNANGPVSDADVLATNALIRDVLAEFGYPLIKLAVCYGGLERPAWWKRFLAKWLHINPGHKWDDKAMPLPGLEDYDIVGGDAYELGDDILPQYDRLLSRLRPEQQLMLFPGGADPWQQEPAPFVTWALAHADRVFAVCPFTWFDREGIPDSGIRDNGMADAYRTAGKLCTGKA